MTAQIPDRIELNGETHSLFAEPLAPWVAASGLRFIPSSTANWRGYVASWLVRDGKLWLVEVSGHVTELPDGQRAWNAQGEPDRGGLSVTLSDLFPGAAAPILADWFSGTLRIPQGDRLRYVHMGYASVFEREVLLTVRAGVVVEQASVDNRAPTK